MPPSSSQTPFCAQKPPRHDRKRLFAQNKPLERVASFPFCRNNALVGVANHPAPRKPASAFTAKPNFGPVVASLQSDQNTFNTARTATTAASVAFQQQSAALRKAVTDARKVFSISWGDDWSGDWVQAGWNDHTTQVPRDPAALSALCASIATFLGDPANADYVVDTPKVVVTAKRYSGFVGPTGSFSTADAAYTAARANQSTLHGGRDTGADALRASLRGLIGVLNEKLGPLDPRWDQFGMPRPGAKTTPGQPTGLTLSKSGTGVVTVLAQCTAVPDATYYRWFAKLDGVDTQFRFVGRTNDPLRQLTGQPAAGQLEVKVEAANTAGPGKAGAAVSIALA